MVMTAEVERRMLAKAETDQVELTEHADGSFFTRSMRTAEHRFYVTTAERCSCQGFATHQRCKHVAAVRAELASRVCQRCQDQGWIDYRLGDKTYRVACPACRPVTERDAWKHWS